MRLLLVLGLGCLLSNGVLGGHDDRGRIVTAYGNAEDDIEKLFAQPEKLEEKLSCIEKITIDNFFLILNIYACSKIRHYEYLAGICEKKFKETEASVVGVCPGFLRVETCLYYFEELFCIGYTHELTPYALEGLKSRINAMITFLRMSTSSDEAKNIIDTYKRCIEEYNHNPIEYKRKHRELHLDEWSFAAYPEWDVPSETE